MKLDYDSIAEVAPELKEFRFKEFCWARMITSSRLFGVTINKNETDVLVPFADMLNHNNTTKKAEWTFHQKANSFVILATEPIERGE